MIKLKQLLKEINMPRWSAVVLDEKSKNELINMFKSQIPDDWEIICHHMTIDFRSIVNPELVGKPITLTITHVGKSDKALAVKVSGYEGKTNNAFPHVTIAINRKNDGKPKDSNDIKNWTPVSEIITLNGKIENL